MLPVEQHREPEQTHTSHHPDSLFDQSENKLMASRLVGRVQAGLCISCAILKPTALSRSLQMSEAIQIQLWKPLKLRPCSIQSIDLAGHT